MRNRKEKSIKNVTKRNAEKPVCDRCGYSDCVCSRAETAALVTNK